MKYGEENQLYRTVDAYNLRLVNKAHTTGPYDFPVIEDDPTICPPEDLIGFNYAKSATNQRAGVHFFIDDYQFERVWNRPGLYAAMLAKYDCVLTPDFSTYTDMPTPMKLWNIYRSRAVGNYFQSQGLRVIPTLQWSDEASLAYCFDGLPKGGIYAVSTTGARSSKTAQDLWAAGMTRALEILEPRAVLHHGTMIQGFDWKGVEVASYTSHLQRMNERMEAA